MKKYSLIIVAASLALFSSCQVTLEELAQDTEEPAIEVIERPGIP